MKIKGNKFISKYSYFTNNNKFSYLVIIAYYFQNLSVILDLKLNMRGLSLLLFDPLRKLKLRK